MIRFLRYTLVLLLGLVILSGCATTQLTSVWKDPAFQSRPNKIVVIGMAKNPLNRRLFEDEFVQQLKAHGTDAIASYTVVPDKQQEDQELIATKLKELDADSVLITRLISKKTVRVFMPGSAYYPPPYYGTWPDYYGYGYRYLYSPSYIAEDEYAVIETNLYQTGNDKLIWAASSETLMTDTNQKMIRSYIDIMVNSMAGYGLLAK